MYRTVFTWVLISKEGGLGVRFVGRLKKVFQFISVRNKVIFRRSKDRIPTKCENWVTSSKRWWKPQEYQNTFHGMTWMIMNYLYWKHLKQLICRFFQKNMKEDSISDWNIKIAVKYLSKREIPKVKWQLPPMMWNSKALDGEKIILLSKWYIDIFHMQERTASMNLISVTKLATMFN